VPSWVFDPKNQVYVLTAFFIAFIVLPMLIILQLKGNDEEIKNQHKNGIQKQSSSMMLAPLFEALDKNMRKKVKSLSDDQWIEILEMSLEVMHLNEVLAKKVNIRDLIK
jgi:hypothetical protein